MLFCAGKSKVSIIFVLFNFFNNRKNEIENDFINKKH